jgi:hypothetical protein
VLWQECGRVDQRTSNYFVHDVVLLWHCQPVFPLEMGIRIPVHPLLMDNIVQVLL